MNTHPLPILLKLERLFWIIFLAGFVGTSCLSIFRTRYNIVHDNYGSNASLDANIADIYGIENGTQVLAATLARIPVLQPISFIANSRDEKKAISGHFVIGYLAWPRQVSAFYVLPEEMGTVTTRLRDGRAGAVFFYDLEPPASWDGIEKIGNRLRFLPSMPLNK